MTIYARLLISSILLFSVVAAATLPGSSQVNRQTDVSNKPSRGSSSSSAREDAYRANNLGVALLEQFKHREGAEEFRRALNLDPQLALARVNLAIALYNATEHEAALREAKIANEMLPDAPQPFYILGLIARAQNRTNDALKAFKRVLEIDSRDVGANVNVGQIYAQGRQYPEALAAFRTALAAEPYNTTAAYNLATTSLRAGEREEGQRLLQRFQALRQSGAGTAIGQSYLEQGRYAEAVTSTGAEPGLVDRATPDVKFVDATASMLVGAGVKKIAGAATSGARSDRGDKTFSSRTLKGADFNDAMSNEIAASLGGGVTLFDFDLDGDLDLFDITVSGQRLYRNDGGKFVDVSDRSGALTSNVDGVGVGAVAGDYDNDSRPDLFVLRYGKSTLYHNDGDGKFSDRTAEAAIPAYPYLSISAAFVDADHDGDLDIFIAGFVDLSKMKVAPLLGQEGPFGKDPLAWKKMQSPFDLAQAVPGAPNMLLRNNGNGTFVDITAAAKVEGTGARAVAVVPTDYDNRRDVDLLIVNYGDAPILYRNMRDTTFRNVAAEVGLVMKGPFTCAAAGDVNKDGYTDFFFGRGALVASETDEAHRLGGVLAVSDGKGAFTIPSTAPKQAGMTNAAQFFDYDNDGLLDLVTAQSDGVHVWRNVGTEWQRVTTPSDTNAGSAPLWKAQIARAFASGDVDADGDVDLVARGATGQTLIGRNDGGNRNRSVRVELTGKVSNRSGIGAKIETRAGSLWQKLETYAATPAPAAADTVFGLGQRSAPDAVRVIWPAGIVQAETEIAAGSTGPTSGGGVGKTKRDAQKNSPPVQKLTVTELDRKPSSCPYLFTWNGERFEFITDFMGGGELGYWAAPGVRAAPDPDEYVRIRGDQLRPRNGRYEIRVTNELEEALFMDRLQLIAVAHPEEVEVYPNEGLGNPTSSTFKLYTTRDARLPVSAMDDHGHDVLARLKDVDRQYPDDFRLQRIRGYADEHTLTLDLGRDEGGGMRDEKEGNEKDEKEANESDGRTSIPPPSSPILPQRTLLLMTGWTDYAFSSDNVAASQSGKSLMLPALQVKDAKGNWQTVIPDIGVPVGRPQTVTVDLTGKFLSKSREVRVVTNMRIYWDRILVDTSSGESPAQMTRLEPRIADLRWRGFSAEATPDGREPFGYTYERVSATSPWKTFPGRYTREGDVRELLGSVDDMFVVSRPGDEISVSFDATALPKLPRGWTRTFLLFAEGYSKEMDINSASPDWVAPLPFKGMKNYPYAAPEAYPMTPAHRAYTERYNTRVVTAPVPQLVTGDR